ncbi:ABC transporter ATP-binding protein [Variovorax sp. Sphag1AA]|uniref:ABC transporter ATP-binding protein n=1 Tax=Variovorax sp. Sphag1AA TaxID=2587027 RepID=UPI00161839E9|nr:ABC transporter ATP-binding protein [Variovorax sp. Sphag1AA]MBB3181477.1 peptide/nickel transport system ATP-binding protein [Variovorax sp. Sphag1AA]
MSGALLQVRDLSLRFHRRGRTPVHALEGVSFDLDAGQTLALVGESGSGKSVTALAIAGLLDPAAELMRGSVRLAGIELAGASTSTLEKARRELLGIVFQNPRRSLNPIRRVGRQIEDALQARRPRPARQARERAVELLAQVGIDRPESRRHAYPWELSGGMCQRVMIALALSGEPALLIADEPTTGLDVSTQAAVMDLIAAQARQRGMATLLITHDLALASGRCQRVAVMHAGHLVEDAPVGALFGAPSHPYSQHLIQATPRHGLPLAALEAVPGEVPDLGRGDLPACRFAERCTRRIERACERMPVLSSTGPGHRVACWNPL